VSVHPEKVAAALALRPMHERQAISRSILLFDGVDPQRLAPLGGSARRVSPTCSSP
jgi:hypothetical protein